jgi:hypothetical protein
MLGFMAMDYFRQSPLLAYPLLALAIFMLVFFVVTVRTVLTQKSRYDAVAQLPLQAGDGASAVRASLTKETSRG